ncbi:uncharacterized protein [Drosophila virilis]|uniref:CH-like domain-containing protein n=1 Tax=Drosophila virilis TaxID=7244 RepID=B4MCX7_DROVI|nr:uncharacterized protein LOC6635440 [Drosophila virilis]EDW58049.1 uncharacterized protein Dvir_GJ15326 [Drosophila virilis]
MSNSRILSAEEELQLDVWLTIKQINLNNRTRRNLCDVANVAKLFKELDYKLVEAHNYFSHSSLSLKLQNWETFNLLVLRKMGMTLSRQALEDLATGHLGAIKSLLYQLMCAERNGIRLRAGSRTCLTGTGTGIGTGTDVEMPDESIPIHTKVVHSCDPQSFLDAKYEELMRESNQMDNYISSITDRIKHLESVKLIKEDRINCLIENLALLSVRTLTMQILCRNPKWKQKQLQKLQQKLDIRLKKKQLKRQQKKLHKKQLKETMALK